MSWITVGEPVNLVMAIHWHNHTNTSVQDYSLKQLDVTLRNLPDITEIKGKRYEHRPVPGPAGVTDVSIGKLRPTFLQTESFLPGLLLTVVTCHGDINYSHFLFQNCIFTVIRRLMIVTDSLSQTKSQKKSFSIYTFAIIKSCTVYQVLLYLYLSVRYTCLFTSLPTNL